MSKRPLRKRQVLHIGLSLLCIGVVIGSGARVLVWANTPNVTSNHVTPTIIPTSTELTQEPLSTTFFNTSIPSNYHVVSSNETAEQSQILVSGVGSTSSNIAFTSRPLPSDGIYGVSDYAMRRNEASGYTLVPPDGFGGSAEYVFRKTGANPEMTAFAIHGNRYMIISLTSGTESLQAEQLQLILSSLQWNQ